MKFHRLKTAIFVVLLLCLSQTSAALEGDVISTVKTVNSETSLEIYIDRWSPFTNLLVDSYIEIQFNRAKYQTFFDRYAQANFNQLSTQLDGGDCKPKYGFGSGDQLSCTVDPVDGKIAVKLNFDSQSPPFGLGFVIKGIINPDSAKEAEPITINIYGPDGVLIDSSESQGSDTFTIETTADTLQDVDVIHSSDVVSAYGDLTVTFEIQHHIINGGNLEFSFPRWDESSGEDELTQSYFLNGQCEISEIRYIGPLTTGQGQATCELDGSGLTRDKILIKDAFKDNQPIDEEFKIELIFKNVRNPPSTRGVSGIEIFTTDLEGALIEQKLDLGYTPTVQSPLPAGNCDVDLTNTQVASLTDITIQIQVDTIVPAGSLIKIVFPPEIKLQENGQIYLKQINTRGKFAGSQDFTISSSPGTDFQNIVTISEAIPEYLEKSNLIYLELNQVYTPTSSGETSSFGFQLIEIFDGEEYLIEGNSEGVTIRTEAQVLTNYQFVSSNREVFAPFSATIGVKFKGILKQTSTINIEYSQSLRLNQDIDTSQISCNIEIGLVNYFPTCTLDILTRTIQFSSFLRQALDLTGFPEGQELRFTLTDLFLNHISQQPQQIAFDIKFQDSSDQPIAFYTPSGNEDLYASSAEDVSQFSVQTTNQVTGDSTQIVMTGELLLGQELQPGFYIDVLLPEQVVIQNGQIQCKEWQISESIDLQIQCSILDQSQGSQTFRIQSTSQSGSLEILRGPASFSLKLESLRNPYSTETSDSFKINVFTKDNYLIMFQTQGAVISASQGALLDSWDITRGSFVNGQSTSYKFTIVLKNPIPYRALLVIEPPQEIIVAAQAGTYVSCEGQSNLKESQRCKLIDTQIKVNLELSNGLNEIPAGENIEITFYSVSNPISLKQSDSFIVELRSEDSAYIYSKQDTGITVQNQLASQIERAEVSASVAVLDADSSYKVDFEPKNSLPKDAIIEVSMPATLTLSTTPGKELVCTGNQSLIGDLQCTYDQDTHVVTIQSGLNKAKSLPEQTIIDIDGFKNPSEPSFAESCEIRTYTLDMFLIDQISDGLGVTQNCDYPCDTCGLTRSTCTSCKKDNPYKYLSGFICLENCPQGQYGDANYDCAQCSSECAQCSGSPTNCLECSNPDDFFHFDTLSGNGRCVDKCPDGQYTNTETGSCMPCKEDCLTCETGDSCLACGVGLIFYQGSCTNECPISMIKSTDGTICVECQSPCKECETTVDQCTSCNLQSDNPFLYGNTCKEACPSGYAPSLADGMTCELISEDVIPFVFLLLAFLVSMIIGVLKLFKTKIHYKNTLIGCITVVCQANWIFLIYLTVKDQMWQSAVVILYAVASSYLLNLFFFCQYWKYMRKDKYYNDWRDQHRCHEFLTVFFSMITSFQLFRIIFQQLSKSIKVQREDDGKGLTKIFKYQDKNTVKQIFNQMTIIMISCVLAPVLVQNVYNLFFTHPGRQLFWEDIESIAITFFLLVMMAYDAKKKSEKIENERLEKYRQEDLKGQTSGVPVDLSERDLEAMKIQEIFKNPGDILKFQAAIQQIMEKQDTRIRVESLDDSEREIVQKMRRNKKNRNLQGATRNDDVVFKKTALTRNNANDIHETSRISAITEDGLTGRALMKGTTQVTDRSEHEPPSMIFKNNESPFEDLNEKQFNNFPIKEVRHESEGEMPTSKRENISGSEGGIEFENLQNIHGEEDTGQLQQVGIMQLVKGQENVRESHILGLVQSNNQAHNSVGLKDQMSSRLRGEEIEAPAQQSVYAAGAHQSERISTYKSQPVNLSLISGANELITNQKEGGAMVTQQTVYTQGNEPDVVIEEVAQASKAQLGSSKSASSDVKFIDQEANKGQMKVNNIQLNSGTCSKVSEKEEEHKSSNSKNKRSRQEVSFSPQNLGGSHQNNKELSNDNNQVNPFQILEKTPEAPGQMEFQINVLEVNQQQVICPSIGKESGEQFEQQSRSSTTIQPQKSNVRAPRFSNITEDYSKNDIEMLSGNLQLFNPQNHKKEDLGRKAIFENQDSYQNALERRLRHSKDLSAKDVKMTDNYLNDSKDSDDMNKNRPVTANTIEKQKGNAEDFLVKPFGALKHSNWQIKSVFDIQQSTGEKNHEDFFEKCESDEERRRNEASIRRGTLMNKSKEIESSIEQMKHQLSNRNDFFQQLENRNTSPQKRIKNADNTGGLSALSEAKSFSPNRRLQYLNEIRQNNIEHGFDSKKRSVSSQNEDVMNQFSKNFNKIKKARQRSKQDFSSRKIMISEEKVYTHRTKGTLSSREEKYGRELYAPGHKSNSSHNRLDVIRTGAKNTQEIEYISKITNKNLMGQDLSLTYNSKSLEVPKKSKNERKLSKNRLSKSKQDKMPSIGREDEMNKLYLKKDPQNLIPELKLMEQGEYSVDDRPLSPAQKNSKSRNNQLRKDSTNSKSKKSKSVKKSDQNLTDEGFSQYIIAKNKPNAKISEHLSPRDKIMRDHGIEDDYLAVQIANQMINQEFKDNSNLMQIPKSSKISKRNSRGLSNEGSLSRPLTTGKGTNQQSQMNDTKNSWNALSDRKERDRDIARKVVANQIIGGSNRSGSPQRRN